MPPSLAGCLAITIGQCTALLFDYEGTNYTSIQFSPKDTDASTSASLFSDDYCGSAVKEVPFPNDPTPNQNTFVSYYQRNDLSFVRRMWKSMCTSI